MEYDLVIRHGLIVDGTGGPAYRSDVGVVDGRIASIGKIGKTAARTVEAEGQIVSPGFIDVHTHMDCQAFWDSAGASSCWQGVTTALMGNCGFSIAPGRESEKLLPLTSMERAEDMPMETMLQGIPWTWESYGGYLDALDRVPKGINYAGYVGHNAIRTYVMGERAFEEEATDNDVAGMCRALRESVRAGAWGFSTTRSTNHRLMNDGPVPSGVASWEEVETLVREMGTLGAGIFELAPEWHADDPERTKDSFRRLKELAVASGRPVTMASGQREPLGWEFYAHFFEEVVNDGGRAIGQVGTRSQSLLYGFKLSLPFDQLPRWREIRARSLIDQRLAFEDPDRRQMLVDEALNSEYRSTVSAEPRPPSYGDIMVVDSPEGPWLSVAEIAINSSRTPVDVMVDLSLDSGFEQLFADEFANRDRDILEQMLSHPLTVIGDGDAGAHASQICDASFFTSFLADWVRRREAFSIEAGIRMCSFDQARQWGFADRGLIRQGLAADLLVFDLATIGPGSWFVDVDLPAGAKRVKQKATGIAATIVNGVVVIEADEHTGEAPGQVLRGPLARA
jgi:N-acyl-D-amino-acid deacylase